MAILGSLLAGEMWALVHVRKMKGFRWVQMLIVICMLSACGVTLFFILDYLHKDGAWIEEHRGRAAWGEAVSFFLLYFNNALYCWLFSLE